MKLSLMILNSKTEMWMTSEIVNRIGLVFICENRVRLFNWMFTH